jgi:hypothetical protein
MKGDQISAGAAALTTTRRRFAGWMGASGLLALTGCGGGGSAESTGSISLIASGALGPGIAADGAGNLFYSSGNTVVKRSAAGDAAPITTTIFIVPLGIAVDGTGDVFVVERGPERFGPSYGATVQRIDKQGQVTRVSDKVPGSGGSGGIWPPSIATGPDGSYYISAVGTLRRVTPDGNVINVTAPEVRRTIDSIAVDAAGNVYFGHDQMVKKIVPGQAEVLLAGSSTEGSADGTGDQARFRFGGNKNILSPQFETSLAVDSSGNVYVADNGNHTVRKISSAGLVTTVAGQAGIAGLETGPLPGKLNAPRGLALQGDKTLYLTSAGAVLKIELP